MSENNGLSVQSDCLILQNLLPGLRMRLVR